MAAAVLAAQARVWPANAGFCSGEFGLPSETGSQPRSDLACSAAGGCCAQAVAAKATEAAMAVTKCTLFIV
jgi:hypothetical protein